MLGCAVAEELFARFPQLPEGKLTRLRASLVREETLAEVAGQIGLREFLLLGHSEALAGPTASTLADALEAVVGAIFLDGGYAAARSAVQTAFGPRIDRLDPEGPAKDAKTQLQEILQAARKPLPEYRVVSVQGEAHKQSFEVECAAGDLTARGRGSSRQRAEQHAAAALLEKLA